MRIRYDNQLQELNGLIERMGQECIDCLSLATQSLLTGTPLASKVQAVSQAAESSAAQVRLLCEDIIVRQQPVAQDLRSVIAAQRMALDMARIASQGVGIADMSCKAALSRAVSIPNNSPDASSAAYGTARLVADDVALSAADSKALPVSDSAVLSPASECRALARMADCVIKMLQDALSSFSARDRALAQSVRGADDEVDCLFRDARAQLVGMMTKGGATKEDAENALDYMLIAKYLERSGDHTVSVANAVLQLMGD